MMSNRSTNTERKAKQAGYHALRGPGQDVVPNESARLLQREGSVSADGSHPPLSGAAIAAKAQQTAAAKAASRNAVRPGPARQGLPVATIAPGQVL